MVKVNSLHLQYFPLAFTPKQVDSVPGPPPAKTRFRLRRGA